MAKGPLCFRLSEDLHVAIEDLAQKAGITTSEWVRDMLYRVVYGEPPGIEQGYYAGRQLGFRVMQLVFQDAWRQVPDTVEEAVTRLQLGSPGRTPHDD